MRLLPLLLFSSLTWADTSVRPQHGCVAAFEAARAQLARKYTLFEEVPIQGERDGLLWWFEEGSCMHHTHASSSVRRTRKASHR